MKKAVSPSLIQHVWVSSFTLAPDSSSESRSGTATMKITRPCVRKRPTGKNYFDSSVELAQTATTGSFQPGLYRLMGNQLLPAS